MEYQYNEASFWRIIISGLIDAALVISSVIYFRTLFPILMVFIVYRLVTIYFFSATLGMRCMKLIYLGDEHESLKALEKISAAFMILYPGVEYYSRQSKIS